MTPYENLSVQSITSWLYLKRGCLEVQSLADNETEALFGVEGFDPSDLEVLGLGSFFRL